MKSKIDQIKEIEQIGKIGKSGQVGRFGGIGRIKRIKLYNRIYGIMPKRYKNWIEQHLIYSGIGIPPEIYVGFTVLYSISLIYAGILLVLTRIIPTQYALLFPFSIFMIFLPIVWPFPTELLSKPK